VCGDGLGTHEICEIHEALDGIVSLFFEQLGLGDRPAGQAPLQFSGKVVDVSYSLHRLARRFCTCSRQQQHNILPTFGIDRDCIIIYDIIKLLLVIAHYNIMDIR